MTKHFKADYGIGSFGKGAHYLSLYTKITEGLSAVVGRSIEVVIQKDNLPFLMSCMVTYCPEVIRAAANALAEQDILTGKYERYITASYDRNAHERSNRVTEAVRIAIEEGGSL